MWSSACTLGWRHWRDDARHHALSTAAVAVGAALVVATLLTSDAAERATDDRLDALVAFGDVALVASAGTDVISSTSLDEIAGLPGIARLLPTLSHSSVAAAPSHGSGGGVSVETEVTVTGYPSDAADLMERALVSGASPTAASGDAVLPRDLADELGVDVGDTLGVSSTAGGREFTVSGLADDAALGLFGGDTVFVDLASAREAFSEPDGATRVDVELQPSVRTTWATDHAGDLPAGVEVQDTSAFATAVEPVLAVQSLVLAACSTVALGLTALLTAHTLRASTRRRASTWGALRALGAPGRWTAAAVLVEASLASALGSSLGVVVGLVGGVLAAPGAVPSLSSMAGLGVVGVSVGTVAGLAGAAAAARDVARSRPVDTLGGAERRRGVIARSLATCLVTAVGVALATTGGPLGRGVAVALAVVLCVVGTPLLLAALGRLLRHSRRWRVATAARRASASGASASVAALCALVTCFATAAAITLSTVAAATLDQVERQFGADVQASVPVALPDDLTDRVRGVPGAETVSASVSGRALAVAGVRTSDVGLVGVDASSWFDVASVPWVDGDDDDARDALARGEGVLLPVSVATVLGTTLGDPVVVQHGGRTTSLVVVGTFASLVTGDQIVVDVGTARSLGFAGASAWDIATSPGADPDLVVRGVDDVFADVPGSSVVTGAQMRARAVSELGASSGALVAVVGVGVAFGALAAAGTWATEASRRRREFATWRAVGAQGSDVGRLLVLDAALVVAAAVAGGLACGVPAGLLATTLVAEALGTALAPQVPVVGLLACCVVVATAILTSSGVTARRTAASPTVLALREAP